MIQSDTRLVSRITLLRCMIPIAVSLVGAGYMLLEHYVVLGHGLAALNVVSGILFFGLVGPMFAWLTLTWTAKAALAEAQAQKEIRRRALQLEAASQASQKVTAILDMDELLSQVVKLVCDSFGYYYVSLFLVDADASEIVLRAGCGQAEQPLKVQGLRLTIGKQGITARVAQTGQPVMCNDVRNEPSYYVHELLPETRSELAIPLRFGDRVVGVFDVQSDRYNAFCQDDVKVLQILADQVAIALENARLFQETRHQFEVMRVLHNISLDITSRLESQQVLAAILEQAALLLHAEGSAIGVYDRSSDSVRIIAVHNLPPEYAGLTMPLPQGVIGQVLRTGNRMIVNDYRHWKGRSPLFDSSPHDAVVSTPLRWHGEVFGALSVTDRAERHPFTEDDARLLSLFADLASIALKNAELYSQVVALSQNMERKIEERTEELAGARKELAQNAEQLQRLLTITVRIQEEERGRIARDLHDGSNQLIAGTLYELQAARESILGQREGVALEKLEKAKSLLRKIEAENRRIILGLRPPILDAQGLVPALKWYAETFYEEHRIPCPVWISGQPVRLSADAETAIYRIVQESLNNVSAHAQARYVQIGLDFSSDKVCVAIEDDGVGFDHEMVRTASLGKMGLIGMRERAQSIGGRIMVESSPGHGTRITLQVPLAGEPEEPEQHDLGTPRELSFHQDATRV